MKILFQTMKGSPNKSLVAHIARCASSLSPSTRRVCKCYGKGRDVMLWGKQSKCDCSSEDFTKPMLSLVRGNRMNMQQKQKESTPWIPVNE